MLRSHSHNRIKPLSILGLSLLLSLLLVISVSAQPAAGRVGHKVIVPAGVELPRDVTWTLRAAYGSYDVVEMSAASWDSLALEIKEQVSLADDMNNLVLNGRVLDLSQEPALQAARSEASSKALQLIQFIGPIQEAWLDAVTATGAELVHYVANNGYVVWADGSARQRLDTLVATDTFLQLSTPYSSSMKNAVNRSALSAESGTLVTIQMLRHEGQAESERRIAELVDDMVSPWEPIMVFQNATVVVQPSAIAQIAALPDVIIVEPFESPQLQDEKQAQTLAGNLSLNLTGPKSPGYLTWLQTLGFPTDPASYPIVDVVDDGFGNGQAAQAGGDVTLRTGGVPAGASRMAYITNCSSAVDSGGEDGHGHLNTSIAGGYDARAGQPFRDELGYQYALGINPYGRFASTRVFDGNTFNLVRCGGTYLSLMRHSYDLGARIINNSWGCASCAGFYNLASQSYDAGTRDVDPSIAGDQSLLAIFSAGNAGSDPETVGSPADGKNVIAVGAVENQRPSWTDSCNYGPVQADNIQDLAVYSSRGPGSGGRTKPDLVAPGTHITGTASTNANYNGFGICDMYYPGGQQLFAASTGTSHAAPAIAGAASLSTWWLQNKLAANSPSPALLKAFLIATAQRVTGTGANDDLPSMGQGYGLPDLGSAFNGASLLVFDQAPDRTFDDSGQSWSQEVQTAVTGEPLKIVLTYTDQPGLSQTNPQVNDLDLVVRVGSAVYHGNNMKGAWSVAGGQEDHTNNVEAVFLPSGTANQELTIEVLGFNIAGDGVPNSGDSTDQDFALVCLNCKVGPPFEEKARSYLPVMTGTVGH